MTVLDLREKHVIWRFRPATTTINDDESVRRHRSYAAILRDGTYQLESKPDEDEHIARAWMLVGTFTRESLHRLRAEIDALLDEPLGSHRD